VRPSYGSVLIPLFEEDGLRLSDIAHRAELEVTVVAQLGERRATDLHRSIGEVSGLATAART
jgi:hypothetical protein